MQNRPARGSFGTDGGHIGFAGGVVAEGQVYIDDLKIRCDGNRDGVFDASEPDDLVEIEETFTITGGFAAEKFVHDARGNLTYDGRYAFTYDAWNRLVKVQRAWRNSSTGLLQTGSTIATMAFDGSGRRVTKAVTNSGDWDCTYHYYHDGHRIVETRDGSDLVLTQQVWGLNYIDELVQTGVNQDLGCSGTYPETPEQAPEICERFFWILQDANYNVLGSVAATGLLTERYEYDPYGRRTVFGHNWLLYDITDDGAVDLSDLSILSEHLRQECAAGDRWDLNGDGLCDVSDLSLLTGSDYRLTDGHANDPLCSHPRGESGRGYALALGGNPLLPAGLCDFGHQGLPYDKEFEKYHNRARTYDPVTMRMMQADPLDYPDGMSRYEYLAGSPCQGTDASGLRLADRVREKHGLQWKEVVECFGDCVDSYYYARGCKTIVYYDDAGNKVVGTPGAVAALRECTHWCAKQGRTYYPVCLSECDRTRSPEMRRSTIAAQLTKEGYDPSTIAIGAEYYSYTVAKGIAEAVTKSHAGAAPVSMGAPVIKGLGIVYGGVRLAMADRARGHMLKHPEQQGDELIRDPDCAVELVKTLEVKSMLPEAGDVFRLPAKRLLPVEKVAGAN